MYIGHEDGGNKINSNIQAIFQVETIFEEHMRGSSRVKEDDSENMNQGQEDGSKIICVSVEVHSQFRIYKQFLV